MADLEGCKGRAQSSTFFYFHTVFGKIGQIVDWRPLSGWRPIGNSVSSTDYNNFNVQYELRWTESGLPRSD